MRVCQFRHIRDCLYIIAQLLAKVKHFLKVAKCWNFLRKSAENEQNPLTNQSK